MKTVFEQRKPMQYPPNKNSVLKALPGFPNATMASVHCLTHKYNWTDENVKWLEKNWIKIDKTEQGMPIYVKPGSSWDNPNFRKADKELLEESCTDE